MVVVVVVAGISRNSTRGLFLVFTLLDIEPSRLVLATVQHSQYQYDTEEL